MGTGPVRGLQPEAHDAVVRNFRQLLLMAAPCMAALMWLRYEVAHPVSTLRVVGEGAARAVTLQPGRFAAAWDAFLVAVALIPLLYLLDLAVFPARRGSGRRLLRLLWVALAIAIVPPAAVAGYSWEGLRSEVTLTADALSFRSGGGPVVIPWSSVRAMRLILRPSHQALQFALPGKTATLDLGPFVPRDRADLVKRSAALADLVQVRRARDEWLWRRESSGEGPDTPIQIAPTKRGAPHEPVIIPAPPPRGE